MPGGLRRKIGNIAFAKRDERTIARRIEVGTGLIGAGLADHFDWRPVSTRAEELTFCLDVIALNSLESICRSTNYPPDVVIKAIVASDLCKPPEVVTAETTYRASLPARRGGPLRREPGKGNIYRATFEVPGYQLVFMSMVGGQALSQSAVLGEALMALAREVCVSRRIGLAPVSYEAQDFADRMISIANASRSTSRHHAQGWPADAAELDPRP